MKLCAKGSLCACYVCYVTFRCDLKVAKEFSWWAEQQNTGRKNNVGVQEDTRKKKKRKENKSRKKEKNMKKGKESRVLSNSGL